MLPWEERVRLINRLMVQMYWCGYRVKDREIVARRILAQHSNDLTSLQKEGRPLFRSKTERRETLKADKGTWFRAMGATATLMVPTTQNSALAKRLRVVLANNQGPKGTTVKVVERS